MKKTLNIPLITLLCAGLAVALSGYSEKAEEPGATDLSTLSDESPTEEVAMVENDNPFQQRCPCVCVCA